MKDFLMTDEEIRIVEREAVEYYHHFHPYEDLDSPWEHYQYIMFLRREALKAQIMKFLLWLQEKAYCPDFLHYHICKGCNTSILGLTKAEWEEIQEKVGLGE